MRRTKLGDVYAVKVPNGYKIVQWAYQDAFKGSYIRVFPGLYPAVPDNIEAIVNSEPAFIIAFDVKRACRTGLFEFIANIPFTDTLPRYSAAFWRDKSGRIYQIRIVSSDPLLRESYYFDATDFGDIPEKYHTSLINLIISPAWLLYLFDTDFSMSEPERFFPGSPGDSQEVSLRKYIDIIEALESAPANINRTPAQ